MFTKRWKGGSNSFSSSFLQRQPRSKSGQVTIFIILGILLLLAAILLILLQQEIISLPIEGIVPGGRGTVQDFVTQCVQDVGEQALSLAGLQGGYIEVPERYTQDITWHLPLSSFAAVPLWANGNERDQPTLDFIKQEVDRYIEENVRDCLFDSQAFQETYDLIENSGVESNTEFFDEGTQFNVRWNLLIQDKAGEVVAEIIEHSADSRVRFKTLYTMANAVLDRELEELKLEDITQDLIALEHDDVPVAGITLDCSQRRWSVSQAQETLKDMLRINLRNLKVKGTEFIEFPNSLPYYQNHYVWDVQESADDVTVLFRFEEDYPFIFQVTPQNGRYMKSERLGGDSLIDFLCIQQWKFTYDVVYPVLVEVRDQESQGIFQMSFDVRLVGNYPYRGQVVSREGQQFAQSDEEAFCYSPHNVGMSVETYSVVNNPESGVYFKEPVADVDITYTCLSYRCAMGQSEYNFAARGDVAGLQTVFPYCVNAVLRASKEGFVDATAFVTAREGEQISLELEPLFEMSTTLMSVVTHEVSTRDCSAEEIDARGEDATCLEIGPALALTDEETALFTLTAYDVNVSETNDGNQTEETEIPSIGLVASEFIDGTLPRHKTEFVLSSVTTRSEDEADVAEFLAQADFEYTLRAYLVNEQELIGGFAGVWEVRWNEISNTQELVFHVLKANPRHEAAYYELLSGLERYSTQVGEPQAN